MLRVVTSLQLSIVCVSIMMRMVLHQVLIVPIMHTALCQTTFIC